MATLKLTMLGSFQAAFDDQPPLAFRSDKVRALLAYLAIESDRPHTRASLCGLLWPEHGDAAALHNLSQSLLRLREALAGVDATPLLLASRQTIQWNQDGPYQLDVAAFSALASSEVVAELERAAELYAGPLLPGFGVAGCAAFEEWLLLTRERLAQRALQALQRLSAAMLASGAHAAAERYARRQLELDPWREEAHRQLMQALAASGQRNAALAQYETCSQILSAELGIEPDIATRALYERIRAGGLSPATHSAAPHNLPAQLTPFVGREPELAELAARLARPDVRLLTLAGAGGMGKTRLALEAARAHVAAFPDGMFFVSLAALTDAAAIVPAVAGAIGLGQPRGDGRQVLLRALGGKRLLLILDNFEHLLDGAGLVVELLQAAPEVRILVTSREPLMVHGEYVQHVAALPYAPGERFAAAVASAAVVLFAQRARSVCAEFQVTEANLPAVLEICRLVDGMPLGLELAAAWTAMLPPELIASELAGSVDFLAVAWRDTSRRHHSLRGVFDWSWQLLNAAEQQVFRALSVFRGGFMREAAHTVADASIGMLSALVRKSLLRRDAAGRFELHEVLRQFAAHELDAAPDERAAVQARHSAYYLDYVARHTHQLARTEPRQATAELRAEIDNIRQAWRWAAVHARLDALEHSGHGLWLFYWMSALSEGEQAFGLAAEHLRVRGEQLSRALPELRDVQRVESQMLAAQAYFLRQQGKNEQALAGSRRAIRLAQASGSAADEAHGHLRYGQSLFRLAHYPDAHTHVLRAMQLLDGYQPNDTDRELVHDLVWDTQLWLGMVVRMLGDFVAARAHMNQSLRSCRGLGKLRGEMVGLLNLAELEREAEHYADARAYSEQALAIARSLGIRWIEAGALYQLGDMLRLQGEYGSARGVLGDAVAILREIGDALYEAIARAWIGRLHTCMGAYGAARTWLEQSLQLSGAASAPEAEAAGLLLLASHLLQTGHHDEALAQATHGYQLAHEQGNRGAEAQGLVILGHAHTAVGRPAEAAQAFEHALALCIRLKLTRIAAEARAGLARLAVMQGNRAQALMHVDAIWPLLDGETYVGLDEPFLVYLVCYDVLHAAGDERAATVLQVACRLLQRYADHINDSSLRRSFLEQVAVHRALRCAADGTAAPGATLLERTVQQPNTSAPEPAE